MDTQVTCRVDYDSIASIVKKRHQHIDRRASSLHLNTDEAAPESIEVFASAYRDTCYAGDLHRADMARARYAAGMALSAGEIRVEIYGIPPVL